jgi:hypothetical protein
MLPRSSIALMLAATGLLLASCQLIDDPSARREVPVYHVVGGALTVAEASSLLEALGADLGNSSVEDFIDEDGVLFFLDEERFQFLPVIEGQSAVVSEEDDAVYTEFMFDLPAVQKLPEPPDVDTAIAAFEAALRSTDLHPDAHYAVGQEVQVNVVPGHSRFELLDADHVPLVDAELDTHVAIELALAADVGFLDLVGPGGSLKMVVDSDGATLVHYELWRLEAGDLVEVIAQTEATAACEALYASEPADQAGARTLEFHIDVTAELVYYAPPFEAAIDTVFPYYTCSGTKRITTDDHGEQVVALRTAFVRATDEAPEAFTPPVDPLPERPENGDVLQPAAFGVHDAGTEWIGESDGLSGSRRNAGRFYDVFDAVGNVDARFNWGDLNAWERDFRDPAFGGTDTTWIDNVDVAFYTGHANGNGFTFTSAMDDGFLHYSEARWGNHDLEWIVIAACGPLQTTTGGLSWAQRWGSAFHRLHLLMAYANDSFDNESEGRIFARAILGVGESPKRVRHAWVKAATSVQPSSVTYAIMGVADSTGMANWNDYFWGRGSGGGPDILNANITYYWRLSGPS